MITYGLVKQNSAYARDYRSSYTDSDVTRIAPKYPVELGLGYPGPSSYAKRTVVDGMGIKPPQQQLTKAVKPSTLQNIETIVSKLADSLLFTGSFAKSVPYPSPPPSTVPSLASTVSIASTPELLTPTESPTSAMSVDSTREMTTQTDIPQVSQEIQTERFIEDLEQAYNESNRRANELVQELGYARSAYLQTKDLFEKTRQEWMQQKNQYEKTSTDLLQNSIAEKEKLLQNYQTKAQQDQEKFQSLENQWKQLSDSLITISEEKMALERKLKSIQEQGKRPSLLDQSIQVSFESVPSVVSKSPLVPESRRIDISGPSKKMQERKRIGKRPSEKQIGGVKKKQDTSYANLAEQRGLEAPRIQTNVPRKEGPKQRKRNIGKSMEEFIPTARSKRR